MPEGQTAGSGTTATGRAAQAAAGQNFHTTPAAGDPAAKGGDGQGSGAAGGNGGDPGAGAQGGKGGAAGAGAQGGGQAGPDESGWDDKTRAYIKKLRDESAGRRTQSKNLEGQFNDLNGKFTALRDGMTKALGIEDGSKLTPEQQVEALTDQADNLQMENLVMRAGMARGVSGEDNIDYFSFLVQKGMSELEEGAEWGDEHFDEVAQKVTARQGTGQDNHSTSAGTGGKGGVGPQGGGPPAPGGATEVTLERFCAMTVTEKTELYTRTPDVYTQLLEEAKLKKLIV